MRPVPLQELLEGWLQSVEGDVEALLRMMAAVEHEGTHTCCTLAVRIPRAIHDALPPANRLCAVYYSAEYGGCCGV